MNVKPSGSSWEGKMDNKEQFFLKISLFSKEIFENSKSQKLISLSKRERRGKEVRRNDKLRADLRKRAFDLGSLANHL